MFCNFVEVAVRVLPFDNSVSMFFKALLNSNPARVRSVPSSPNLAIALLTSACDRSIPAVFAVAALSKAYVVNEDSKVFCLVALAEANLAASSAVFFSFSFCVRAVSYTHLTLPTILLV